MGQELTSHNFNHHHFKLGTGTWRVFIQAVLSSFGSVIVRGCDLSVFLRTFRIKREYFGV